jgi:hypothetical protein
VKPIKNDNVIKIDRARLREVNDRTREAIANEHDDTWYREAASLVMGDEE